MAQGGHFVTLGDLFEEPANTDRDNCILERVKLLAQEHLPEGWADWKVMKATKEEVFGDSLDPQLLNKLRFALPTVGLARAFDPEIDRLSERSFRELKIKLLDWEFTRALIMSPPAVSNRIRGSAFQTEIFNKALVSLKPLLISRAQAEGILSGETISGDERVHRRRNSSSSMSSIPKPKKSKFDILERRMENMFATFMNKIESLKTPVHRDEMPTDNVSEGESDHSGSYASYASLSSWKAPQPDPDLIMSLHTERSELPEDLEFLPVVKEADSFPNPIPKSRRKA